MGPRRLRMRIVAMGARFMGSTLGSRTPCVNGETTYDAVRPDSPFSALVVRLRSGCRGRSRLRSRLLLRLLLLLGLVPLLFLLLWVFPLRRLVLLPLGLVASYA